MHRKPVTLRLARLLAPGLVLSATLAAQNPHYALLGNGCAGSMPIARLSLVTPPAIGSTFQVDVTNLPVSAAIMLAGFSNTVSPFGPLPLQLAGHGMPGCVAYVSPDAIMFLAGTGNRAAFALAIPANSWLVGLGFYQQALVLDPTAGNSAGAVVSDAAYAILGQLGWPTAPIANMMPIAAGTFLMGSNAATGAPYYSSVEERPVHQVTISRPFWMGRYEVTQAEYQAVMSTNPSFHQGTSWPNSASRPVEQVTWNDAMAYCAALTARERAAGRLPAGYQYRLPTEAEWEYCCRAGTTTEFHYGNSLLCGQANFAYSYHSNTICYSSSTVAVGNYVPNAWGLYDMHGNVWEWCLDWWDGSPNYPAGAVSDPYVTSGPDRVGRGGSWGVYSHRCLSADRGRGNPVYGTNNQIGFRVVLAPVLIP